MIRLLQCKSPLACHDSQCCLQIQPTPQDYARAVPTGNEVLREEVSKQAQNNSALKSYQQFIQQLQQPESAALVNGMRNYIRNITNKIETQQEQQQAVIKDDQVPNDSGVPKSNEEESSPTTEEPLEESFPIAEALSKSIRSYVDSTMETIQQTPEWQSIDLIRPSLESFLYGHLQSIVQTTVPTKDLDFWKKCLSLQFITPLHLDIACFSTTTASAKMLLQGAVEALQSIPQYHSPFEKLQRILQTYHCVNEALSKALNHDKAEGSNKKLPSADDVLPTLILTVLYAQPPTFVSTLKLVEIYCPPEQLRGEAGYAFTNLYGAMQFLVQLKVSNEEAPTDLTMTTQEFQQGLAESRSHMERMLATLQPPPSAKEEEVSETIQAEETKDNDLDDIHIPVQAIRDARLKGEDVNLDWARRWYHDHVLSKRKTMTSTPDTTFDEGTMGRSDQVVMDDSLPSSSLPVGWVRSYTFLTTQPEEVRMADLPQLLTEYRMLVKGVEQLLGERSAREAAERKQRLKDVERAIQTSVTELGGIVNIQHSKKKKKDEREEVGQQLDTEVDVKEAGVDGRENLPADVDAGEVTDGTVEPADEKAEEKERPETGDLEEK